MLTNNDEIRTDSSAIGERLISDNPDDCANSRKEAATTGADGMEVTA